MSRPISNGMRLHWLFASLTFGVLLAVLHAWAMSDFLYWRYQWLDIPMHYLGGVTFGVFIAALLLHKRMRIYVGTLTLIFIGWEVFEFMFGLPREANYLLDTLIDIVMDILGAITVYIIARKTIWRA